MNSNQTIAVTLPVATAAGSWNRHDREEPVDSSEAYPEKNRKAAEPLDWRILPIFDSQSNDGNWQDRSLQTPIDTWLTKVLPATRQLADGSNSPSFGNLSWTTG